MAAPARSPDRGRAVAVLVVVGIVAIALIGALGYLVISAITNHRTPVAGPSPSVTASATGSADAGSQQGREDALAAAPMMQLPQSAAQPQPLVTDSAGPPIVIPAPTAKVVPGGPPVATGFPHTPEGALAQLAAIDEAALSTTDLDRVHEVYAWSAMPGAVSESEWSPTVGVKAIIDNLGGQQRAARAHASFQAVEGQLKGTVGPDFVLACVLGEADIVVDTVARIGVGDCQRMVWSGGRWRIGPGAQPAYAPSAWPGSADSVRAGWRVLKRAK